MRKFLAVVAILGALGPARPVTAQESTPVSVSLGVDALSGYIWRGGILGADDKFCLQPSLTFGFGESGLSLNVWGSVFAHHRTVTEGADEMDFTVDYSRSFPDSPVGVSIGYIQYTFPSASAGAKHSEELYGGLSVDHRLAPSVKLYYDFGLLDDFYLVAGIAPSVPVGEGDKASLGLSASVGISSYGGKTGFNDVTLGAGLSFPAGSVTLTPKVGVVFGESKVNPNDVSVWGGLNIGWSN